MADPFETYQRIGGGSYDDLLDQLTRVDYSNLTPIQPVGLESLIDTYGFGLTPTYGTYPSLDTFDTLEDVEDVDILDEYDDVEDTNITATGFPTSPVNAARKISSAFTLGPLGLAMDLGLGALTDKGYFGNSGIMAQRYLSPSGFYGGNIGTKGATTFGDGIDDGVADNPGMGFGSGVDDPSLDEGDTGDAGTGAGPGASPGDAPPGVGPGDGTGEGGDAGSGGDSKIVCTMMNESYGFGSFRNKIWLKHSKDLPKEYEKGYHKIFLPLVKYAKSNKLGSKVLKKTLEHIAKHRTIDIKKQFKGKIHLLGRIYRKILEPLCYWVGKF